MAGGPPPSEVRDDYLESYAGDRFVESARYVRTYPTELPGLAEKTVEHQDTRPDRLRTR